MDELEYIRTTVHDLYWSIDENCARTTLRILSHLFFFPLEEQTLDAAIGMHGAGGLGAQCGLVEGSLMFIGDYLAARGMDRQEIVACCREYAELFSGRFGSLSCHDLRPGGFREDDPPHRCEGLAVEAIGFTFRFLKERAG